MKEINSKRLKQLIGKCRGKRVAVIGDIMLDRYLWGTVSRISPEAPVPVVEVHEESSRLGGAGNVANNILSLGGDPVLFGIVGDDLAGKDVFDRLDIRKYEASGIIVSSERPTTIKRRVIADNQHVVRADSESKVDLSTDEEKKLIGELEKQIDDIDCIILQDYNKGVITRSLIHTVIEIAAVNNTPVTVDPKFKNFFEYKKVNLFKPNLVETQNAVGYSLSDEESIENAGRELLKNLECDHVLITRGSDGMSLFSKNGFKGRVHTKAKEIAEVSGAGDTVISTLSMIIASGGDILEAATIANHAAGVVVGEVGIVPIDPEKLIRSVENDS